VIQLILFLNFTFAHHFLDQQVNSQLVYEVEQVLQNPYVQENIEIYITDTLNLLPDEEMSHVIRYKRIDVRGKLIQKQIHTVVATRYTEILCKSLLERVENHWDVVKQSCYLDKSLVNRP